MSTNATIANQIADDDIRIIYLHWDGDSAGETLVRHYSDPAKVAELIKLGDLSSLGPEIGEQHDFNSRDRTVCTAYGRDRGESDTEALRFSSLEELERRGPVEQYNYIFKDGKWHSYKTNYELEEMTDA